MVSSMIETTLKLYPAEQIPEALCKSKGFLIYFPPEIQKFAELYDSLPLNQKLKRFLKELFEVLIQHGIETEGYCSFQQITDHLKRKNSPSGKTLVYDRTKALSTIGLLEEQYYKASPQSRRSKIYILCKPIINTAIIDPIYLETPIVEKKKPHDPRGEAKKAELLIREEYGDRMLDTVENRSYRDLFMSTMMSKCIRLDAGDDRKKLESNFLFKDTPVGVTTTTLTDGNIALSSDIRYVMVFTTFCMEIMNKHLNSTKDSNNRIENSFLIDLNDVATHIGNKRTTGNRLTAYNAAKRLYQTNFEISTQEESEFAERFLTGYNEVNYRFLSDFKAIVVAADETDDMFSDEEVFSVSEAKNPRWIRVSLWHSTFETMWQQAVTNFTSFGPTQNLQFFAQNPEVVKNKSPICYHLYSHLSAWVGVSGNVKKGCNTVALHDYMIPSSRYQNFLRDLINLFNGLLPKGAPPITKETNNFSVNLYGYIVVGRQLNNNEKRQIYPKKALYLTFHRDVKDFYIGDKSRHNTLMLASSKKDNNNSGQASSDSQSSREGFLRAKKELNKSPDDIDIPTAKRLTNSSVNEQSIREFPLFNNTCKD